MQFVRCIQLVASAVRIDSNHSFRVSSAPAIHAFATAIEFGVGTDGEIVTIVVAFENENIVLVAAYEGGLSEVPHETYRDIKQEIDRAINLIDARPKRQEKRP